MSVGREWQGIPENSERNRKVKIASQVQGTHLRMKSHVARLVFRLLPSFSDLSFQITLHQFKINFLKTVFTNLFTCSDNPNGSQLPLPQI